MQQPIKMVRGTSKTIKIKLMETSGQEHAFVPSEELHFAIKRTPTDAECEAEITLTSSHYEDGFYILNLSPSVTENLPVGEHFYDIGCQNGAEYLIVIECSSFFLIPNISSREV